MTDTLSQLAKSLTEAQREAVLSASPTIGGAMQVWHCHRGTIKSVHKKGLCSEPNYRNCATELPLGAALRAHLKGQSDEG